MKIKTILGLIACTGACASYSAFGGNGDWFDVSTSTTNKATVTCSNADGVTIESNKFKIDTDDENAMIITPSEAVSNTCDGVIFITGTAELTASSTNDLETIVGAKAGFAVAYNDLNQTNFYGYASNETPNWFKLTGVNPGDGETTFTLKLDYRTGKKTVSFFIGDTQLSGSTTNVFDIASDATALARVDVWGCGKLASVNTDFEVAVAEYDGVKYGSIADAIKAAGENNTDSIAVVDETGTPRSTENMPNGLKEWECAAIGVATNEEISVTRSATKQNTNKITIAADTSKQDPTVDVKYQINGVGTEYDADNIQIPMETGTYKIVPVIRAK